MSNSVSVRRITTSSSPALIVLTVFYGAVAAVSRYFTDSNDAGIVVLAALQWLFAAPVMNR